MESVPVNEEKNNVRMNKGFVKITSQPSNDIIFFQYISINNEDATAARIFGVSRRFCKSFKKNNTHLILVKWFRLQGKNVNFFVSFESIHERPFW